MRACLAAIVLAGCGQEAPAPPAVKRIERHGFSFQYAAEMRLQERREEKFTHFDFQELTVSVLPDFLMPRETAQRTGVMGLKEELKPDRILSEVEIDEPPGKGTKLIYEKGGRTKVVRYFTLWGARNTYVVVLHAELATEAATLEKFRPVLQSLTLDR